MLYLDNGPVTKSRVFSNMMRKLHIDWQTHTPAGKEDPNHAHTNPAGKI